MNDTATFILLAWLVRRSVVLDKRIRMGLCLHEIVNHLDEADVRGLLLEAATAEVEAVLADQTLVGGAEAAVYHWLLR